MLTNRRARHDYEILDTFEAGIVLSGSEIKALRQGGGSLQEAYAAVRGGEVFLEGMNIPPYKDSSYNNHEPLRSRKLLLHRREIQAIVAGVERRGLTLVPLRLYFKEGWAKLTVALARGRKRFDKREREKERDAQRQIERALRR